MRFFLVLLITTAVAAAGSYRVIEKVFTKSSPRVLQAEVVKVLTPTPKPTTTPTPTPHPTITPTPTPKPTLALHPTNTPTPTPLVLPPPPATPGQVNAFIERFAVQYAVSSDVLRYIAICEAGFNPLAVNGPYVGLYQFSSSAWISNRKLMGGGYKSCASLQCGRISPNSRVHYFCWKKLPLAQLPTLTKSQKIVVKYIKIRLSKI